MLCLVHGCQNDRLCGLASQISCVREKGKHFLSTLMENGGDTENETVFYL